MSTTKHQRIIPFLLTVFSLSAFLYINFMPFQNAEMPSSFPETTENTKACSQKKENAGLLPEVELIKETYTKFKKIKPLFDQDKTP